MHPILAPRHVLAAALLGLLAPSAAAGSLQRSLQAGTPVPAEKDAWELGTEQVLGAEEPAWQDFLVRHPGRWRGRWDTRTARPSLLYGPGIRLAASPLEAGSEAMVHALALEFLDDHEALLDLRRFELEGVPSLAGETWILDFSLSHQGVPLEEHSRVALRIKPSDAGLAALKLEAIPALLEPATPSVPAITAVRVGLEALGQGATVMRVDPPRLCYRDDELGTGRLAWRFRVGGRRAGLAFSEELFVGAHAPATVQVRRDLILHQAQEGSGPRGPSQNLTGSAAGPGTGTVISGILSGLFGCSGAHDYAGNVRGKVLVGGPDSDRDWRPLSDAIVSITQYGSGSAYTNSNGDFSISSTSSSSLCWVRMKSDLTGRWCDVVNGAGSDLDEREYHGHNGAFNFSLNSLPSEHKTAQTTAFYWTTRSHDWSSGLMGGNNGVERQILCRVNLGSVCDVGYNACFDVLEESINFAEEVGWWCSPCPNLAFSDVIAHEYGHAVDHGLGSILNYAYSEGFGDAFAMALTDQGLVGRATSFTRDGSAVRAWPASECDGESHCLGETFGGFTYELTQLLKARYGSGAGRTIADRLVLLPAAANPSSIPDAVFETFVADDVNSSLDDGTPNWCEIVAAARSRNLPIPVTLEAVHYRFDGAATLAHDSAAPFNDGSTTAAFDAGGLNGGGAVSFTLESPFDSFSVPDAPELDLTGAMTGSAWIRPAGNHDVNPSNCVEGTIFTKGYNYWFQLNNDNSGILFQNDQSGAPGTSVGVNFGPNYFPPGVWSHVAFVRTGPTSVRLYKDGAYIGGGSTLLTPTANAAPLTIGHGADATACEFNGAVDEVQIFPRALCDSEVMSLYCAQATCFQ